MAALEPKSLASLVDCHRCFEWEGMKEKKGKRKLDPCLKLLEEVVLKAERASQEVQNRLVPIPGERDFQAMEKVRELVYGEEEPLILVLGACVRIGNPPSLMRDYNREALKYVEELCTSGKAVDQCLDAYRRRYLFGYECKIRRMEAVAVHVMAVVRAIVDMLKEGQENKNFNLIFNQFMHEGIHEIFREAREALQSVYEADMELRRFVDYTQAEVDKHIWSSDFRWFLRKATFICCTDRIFRVCKIALQV